MLECVPNFSEGRDKAVVQQIVQAIAGAPRVLLAGWEMDPDHHRSVVTFAGPDEAVIEGAVRGVGRAAALINLSAHQGAHPRVGAADVVPFTPLGDTGMEAAVIAAHRVGERIWRRYGIPAYFYGEAARLPSRVRLERTRRAEFDGLPPDVGDLASHPTAGATMVGARNFLVAYNVRLDTANVAIAKSIAERVRESSGGFRYVKALGLDLPSNGCTQVSMNLTNFARTPLNELWDTIRTTAAQHGTLVLTGEIIGFIPRAAYEQSPEFFEHAENFSQERILETRLEQLVR